MYDCCRIYNQQNKERIEASTFEDFDWVMGVCLGAVVNRRIIFVPRMIKAYAGKTSCHVVTTSSLGAFMGGATTAPYSASKAAVNNLMYSYYDALKPYGFGVTVLFPANINSNIGEAEKHRPEKFINTGYSVTDKTIGLLKAIHASGMDPVELARWLKAAIENEQVVCVPYENSQEILERELGAVIFYASPEGMKKLDELDEIRKKGLEEMMKNAPHEDVGFAKARSGLDWVDASHKF